MCGISGIYTTEITPDHQKLINGIIQSQIKRGPDHQAALSIRGKGSEALLGHNRLSIIDLSEQANQPMWDATDRYCIVFNGEIYNYLELREELVRNGLQFHTRSDTEVVLNAFAYWGMDALQYFRGPFAFVLFDVQTEKLWLARDRFGVRPLYYLHKNNTLYFASTTNTLAKAFHLTPNYAYVARGLQSLVYEDGSQSSPWQDLFSLPAGCYLQACFNSRHQLIFTITSYYDLAHKVEELMEILPINNLDSISQMLLEKFENAVNIRLRTDVPLAISLSGGLDSSSIAALVGKQHHDTIGFSFSHPDNRQSEGPLVANCARYLNIKMEYVWPTPEEMVEALDQTLIVQDAPFSTLSIVAQYLLYKHVHACSIKVLLGGQGGDEAFMGYKKFMLFWIRHMLQKKQYFPAFKNMLHMLPGLFSEMTALKSYWQHRHRYIGKTRMPDNQLRLPATDVVALHHVHHKLWQRQLQDITQFSLPTLLRYEDRNAMGNSVESRLPWLDHQLIEFGLALPEAIKLRSGYGKWIIREMMQNKIPDNIRLARYKRGFDIPLKTLLHKGLGHAIRSQLQNGQQIVNEFLPARTSIASLFSDQQFLQRYKTMGEAIALLWLNKALA